MCIFSNTVIGAKRQEISEGKNSPELSEGSAIKAQALGDQLGTVMCSASEGSFSSERQELRSKEEVCIVALCQIRAEINLQEKTNETWLERTFLRSNIQMFLGIMHQLKLSPTIFLGVVCVIHLPKGLSYSSRFLLLSLA